MKDRQPTPGGRALNRRRAFTLLEILVVISIMGLLIAISFPSLKRARQKSKDTQCLNRLRSLYMVHLTYLQDNDVFPALNNDKDDGAWQYNYSIFDGRDFEENFGPLINDGLSLNEIEVLFCPVQTDEYHSLPSEGHQRARPKNPWPVRALQNTRSSYARRYHLSGRSLAQIPKTIGLFADVFHLPAVIRSGHKNGINAAYSDGHVRFVRDPGKFTDNDLAKPFDPVDNIIIRKLWHIVDRAK